MDGQILYEHYLYQLDIYRGAWGANILSVTTSQGVALPNTVQFGVPWGRLNSNAKEFWNQLASSVRQSCGPSL